MRQYMSVSFAPEDAGSAERLCREMARYGFFSVCAENSFSRAERDGILRKSEAVIVVTSPAAELFAACAEDVRHALGMGKPVICVSLTENRLDERFCADPGSGAELVRMPAQDGADEMERTVYFHQLYLRRLCRYAGCFSKVRCVDDVYSRAIRQAVAAYAGDMHAQWALGQMYEKGEGVPCAPTEAAHWTELAAGQGLSDAMIRLGEYKIDGEGTPRDPDGALALFRRAADRGDVRGTYHFGLCCLYGYGMMPDPELAVRTLRAATDAGYTPARYRLALLYRDGIGTAADWRAAVHHLYIACAEITGYRQPDTRIGAAPPPDPWSVIPLMDRRPVARRRQKFLYYCITMRQMREKCLIRLLYPDVYGRDKASVDPKRWCDSKKCMRRTHPRRRIYREDEWLSAPPDPERDISRYNRKQSYGHQRWDVSLAAGALGRLLELGSPAEGIRPAPVQALRWYRRAMARGHSGAMFRLGDCYRRGVGAPATIGKAVDLYQRAAQLNNERGQFALGVCFENGKGVSQDPAAAAHWYELSAREGYPPAQNNLGGCYEYGVGVPQDILTAVEWYTRAAGAGQPEAACRLGLCYEMGKGVTKDAVRAYQLYEQAAQKEHPYAMYRLGLCCDRGMYPSSDTDGAHTGGESAADPMYRSAGMTVGISDGSSGGTSDGSSDGTSDAANGAGGTPRFAYAAHLYERAARRGVADAAYAFALCCRNGRGVRRDGGLAYEWFCVAAERGSIQGAYEAGICTFEGRDAIRNRVRAVDCFRKAAALWTEREGYRHKSGAADADTVSGVDEVLPVDGISSAEAAGRALYMLGYCLLYGIGRANRPMKDDSSAEAASDREASGKEASAENESAAEAYVIGATVAPEDIVSAKDCLERSAATGNVAAMTALGDLYRFGLLLPDGTPGIMMPGIVMPGIVMPGKPSGTVCTPEARLAAEPYYRRATEGAVPGGRMDREGRTNALLSLADFGREAALEAASLEAASSEAASSEVATAVGEAWTKVWRLLTEANRAGSAEAAIRMAECAYYGRGIAADPDMAGGLLERADRMQGGCAKAALWRGIFCQHRALTATEAEAATLRAEAWDAYVRAAGGKEPLSGSTGTCTSDASGFTDYSLRERGILRDGEASVVRAEAKYRLAVLSVTEPFSGAESDSGADGARRKKDGFEWLVGAILDGHRRAADDFARMYASEQARHAAKEAEYASHPLRIRRRMAAEAVRAAKKAGLTGKSFLLSGGYRHPWVWMEAYYAENPPMLRPFAEPDLSGLEADGAAVVTPVMRAQAMNYVGDCLFYGQGVRVDPAAAVYCYRAAASTPQGRGEPVCGGIVWAQYSLGWCLLNGVGVKRDAREAVQWLTRCAKLHADAACLLAWCHENGAGVDAPNDREAIKYYRRAVTLGSRPAVPRLAVAERRLKRELEDR